MKQSLILSLLTLALGTNIAISGEPELLTLGEATIIDLQAAMDAGDLTAESLLGKYLERIAHYEKHGPNLHSIISINGRAILDAKALDEERKVSGPRSLLHGIPIALKDNIDTYDVATSGGAISLKHSFPPDDAFLVRQLRKAGAVIFIKTNLSEFASGAPGLQGASSLGGQPRNPYNPLRHADGSSSGTGAALAAVFAQVGYGTETGSSVRGPSAHNNLVGLSPTEGLMSRDGVIPLSFTLDRVGVMGRYVEDVAILLNHSIGIDFSDQLTRLSTGMHPEKPYYDYIKKDGTALAGVRLGVFREVFTSNDPRCAEAIELMNVAIGIVEEAGARVIDPVESGMGDIVSEIALSDITPNELASGLNAYLASLGKDAPIHTLEQLLEDGGIIFNKFDRYEEALKAPPMETNPVYIEQVKRRKVIRELLVGLMDKFALDGLIYLHNLYPPQYVNEPHPYTKVRLSSVSGLPAMIIPGGFTKDNQPIGFEILGRPFSEPQLLNIAYGIEQATGFRKMPEHTPELPTDRIGN